MLALGLYCYQQLDIEAYPNPVAPMIEIITQPNGWSAEEVERYVTIPLENGLNGMIDLDHIRSQSLFGLSDVKCYFTWNADYHLAQQRVLNRLGFVSLPPGMTPQLSPWSAIGEVFRYVVRGEGYSLADLKTAQDWILERQFRQAPGVIDVVGFGGETKEYHVEVDPYRLKGHGVTLTQLETALVVVEPERRRPAAQHRRAVVRRARHRHHPFAGRHPRRGPVGAEGDADPRARRGRGDRRARAAPGDRRQGSRSRRRAGDGAHALRRRLAEDARRRPRAGRRT